MSPPAFATRRSLPMLLFSLMTSACVTSQISPTVVAYNRTVANPQNEMLLLNIVRAAKWKPMYLVDLSKITGSLKQEVTASLDWPFGGESTTNNVAKLSGTVSVNPTFDVNVLSTQDFMTGFLQPVTPDQLAYFLGQSYSPELLLHLFVHRIDGLDPKQTLLNHPHWDAEDNGPLLEFGRWISTFAQSRPKLVRCPPVEVQIGPEEIPVSGIKDFKLPPSTEMFDYRWEPLRHVSGTPSNDSSPNIFRHFVESIFGDPPTDASKDPPIKFTLMRVSKRSPSILVPGAASKPCSVYATLKGSESFLALSDSEYFDGAALPDAGYLDGIDPAGQLVRFRLRSPESILYYLGQLLRVSSAGGGYLRLHTAEEYNPAHVGAFTHKSIPLFVASLERASPSAPAAAVDCGTPGVRITDDDGDTYVIPRTQWPVARETSSRGQAIPESEAARRGLEAHVDCRDPGLTYSVMEIVTQLISLHKAAKDIPTTPVVRAIGQ